jgi:hypothetical protein
MRQNPGDDTITLNGMESHRQLAPFSDVAVAVEICSTWCYVIGTDNNPQHEMTAAKKAALKVPAKKAAAPATRVFKTKKFAKLAKKVGIPDSELCHAAAELTNGLGENLGGSVWKKRLRNGDMRTRVFEKIGVWWVFVHLFGKQDEKDISEDVERGFKAAAKHMRALSQVKLDAMVANGDLLEICKNG